MHEVLGHLDREIAADRARRGLARVGRPHEGADHLEGLGPSTTIATSGLRGDEGHEVVEERLAVVLGVVLLRGGRVERAQLERRRA